MDDHIRPGDFERIRRPRRPGDEKRKRRGRETNPEERDEKGDEPGDDEREGCQRALPPGKGQNLDVDT